MLASGAGDEQVDQGAAPALRPLPQVVAVAAAEIADQAVDLFQWEDPAAAVVEVDDLPAVLLGIGHDPGLEAEVGPAGTQADDAALTMHGAESSQTEVVIPTGHLDYRSK